MTELSRLPKTSSILIVDDLPEMRQMISATLEMNGYTKVTEARNGEDAFQKIKANSFDLAIVDLNMPKLDGIELTKKIRADFMVKKLPIIVVTAHAEQARVMAAIKAGANEFIAKPFNPDVLMQKLKKIFG